MSGFGCTNRSLVIILRSLILNDMNKSFSCPALASNGYLDSWRKDRDNSVTSSRRHVIKKPSLWLCLVAEKCEAEYVFRRCSKSGSSTKRMTQPHSTYCTNSETPEVPSHPTATNHTLPPPPKPIHPGRRNVRRPPTSVSSSIISHLFYPNLSSLILYSQHTSQL